MTEKILIISFILAILGFIILFITQKNWSDRSFKFKRIGAILIIQLIIVAIFSITKTSQDITYTNFSLKQRLYQKDFDIYLDGILLDSATTDHILEELIKYRKTIAHHSYPTKKRELLIVNNEERIHLIIRKDSEINNEYWVYWPERFEEDEIKRIIIDLNGQ